MSTPEDVVEAVLAGPKGADIGAFFDLDGTIVAGYTATAFWNDRVRNREVGLGEMATTIVAAIDGALLGGDPTKMGDVSVESLRGHSEDELVEFGERLFVQKTAATIRTQSRDLIRAHLRMGHTVVVASAATRFQIGPIAHDLGITNILCTEVEVEDGIFTGQLAGPMLWGEPKARAVRKFARDNGIDLPASYAYANGDEDIAFLSSVGQPHALNPQRGLREAATQQKWTILEMREPKRAGLRALASTTAAMAGAGTGLGVGAALGILHGDKRFGVNTGLSLAADTALAVSGVRLNVIGEPNLWNARPAIFIANHQSSLDVLVVGSLLRRDYTMVGKKEARYDPRALLGGLLIDPVYIDRSNPETAIDALSQLRDRVQSGTSIVVFPEGTRAATPELGPFKKGAFHMAMQAGVPIVPIVLRNTGELMWRRSKLVNPGVVDVCVLDPIPTDGWTPEDITDVTEQVRQQFVDTLEEWPEEA
ncbi:HAD-IB family hydrolase [Luteipulveratus mongoliensis]|uniref:Phospholipid/glycerol acyltransferase domain-containing protein n=1 Tax=Luteipulveratus mongoliensis TaxID=571913 RepID=A0A0K1JP25_9MICO|nr:HAD-IB family hydrolase [Luteipulveratus mongoliensis]AKU18338.1 hypothetical protein VV02_24985 [Luteipulveratus mongoliensis]